MSRPRALSLATGRDKLELRHRKILRALAWAYPAPLKVGDLIAAVWDGKDEPDTASNVIRCAIYDLRAAGWVISCRYYVGYALAPASFDRLTLPINQQQGRAR